MSVAVFLYNLRCCGDYASPQAPAAAVTGRRPLRAMSWPVRRNRIRFTQGVTGYARLSASKQVRFSMPDIKNPLLNSAVFLAAATGFLYCAGTAYFGGYLGSLRLDADVLDRNFHQVLYQGFFVSFGPVLLGLLAYLAVVLLYTGVVLPHLTDWLRTTPANKRRYVKARKRWIRKRKSTIAEKLQQQRLFGALRYTVLGILFILALVYFEWQGRKMASPILKQIGSQKITDSSSIIHVKVNEQEKSLLYLGCGARNCAGLDLSSKTIYYFPQNGHSYQYAAPTPVASPPASHRAP